MTISQPKNRIKILYIITQDEMGGAQRYVLDLASSLEQNKYEVLVLAGGGKQDLSSELKQRRIEVRTVKHLKRSINPFQDILAFFELKRIICDYKPDILHLNSSKAGAIGSLAGRMGGVKNIIFTAHGFAFLEPHPWLIRWIYFWAEKLATVFRKKIITVSEYDRQAAIKSGLGPTEKFVTVHNGIQIDVIPSETTLSSGEARAQNDKQKWPIIGTIANLYPTKGLSYLLDAAKMVIKDFPEAKFVVIGEGRERKNLELRIRNYELKNNFFLIGAKKNASQYLSAFDIFVLPSLKEGFPYTILEAMMAELPIVATAVGGIPEALTNNQEGLLVQPKNPSALTEAINKLIASPSLAKTLAQNAKWKVKKFSLSKMVEKTLKVYHSLISF